MRKILALVLVCASLSAMAAVTGNKISLFDVYDWSKDANGVVTVTPHDPMNMGGWSAVIVDGENAGQLFFRSGFTMYELPQSLLVDYALGTVTLEATGEPFHTVEGHSSTASGQVTTKVDSTLSYYFVNEDWLLNDGALADVNGTIADDGSITIEGGFGYYIVKVKTTTISTPHGVMQQVSDTTRTTSPLFRHVRLLTPNGKHEYTILPSGNSGIADVYIHQEGDTVYVTNLYGLGWESAHMILNADGTMTFPCQTIGDISDAENPGGSGLWQNMGGSAASPVPGNSGTANSQSINWGLTMPSDGNSLWPGYDDNWLYFTDGSQFVIPTPPALMRGDVNDDGKVDITDATTLINYLLYGDDTGINMTNADTDLTGGIDISDATALINYLLYGTW